MSIPAVIHTELLAPGPGSEEADRLALPNRPPDVYTPFTLLVSDIGYVFKDPEGRGSVIMYRPTCEKMILRMDYEELSVIFDKWHGPAKFRVP